ncbi:hypothetical protein Emag_002854 [Eimeria magna]
MPLCPDLCLGGPTRPKGPPEGPPQTSSNSPMNGSAALPSAAEQHWQQLQHQLQREDAATAAAETSKEQQLLLQVKRQLQQQQLPLPLLLQCVYDLGHLLFAAGAAAFRRGGLPLLLLRDRQTAATEQQLLLQQRRDLLQQVESGAQTPEKTGGGAATALTGNSSGCPYGIVGGSIPSQCFTLLLDLLQQHQQHVVVRVAVYTQLHRCSHVLPSLLLPSQDAAAALVRQQLLLLLLQQQQPQTRLIGLAVLRLAPALVLQEPLFLDLTLRHLFGFWGVSASAAAAAAAAAAADGGGNSGDAKHCRGYPADSSKKSLSRPLYVPAAATAAEAAAAAAAIAAMVPYLSGDLCVSVLHRCLAAALPSPAAEAQHELLLRAGQLQREASALGETPTPEELLQFLLQQRLLQQQMQQEEFGSLTLQAVPPIAHRLSFVAATFGAVSPLLPVG